MSTFDLSKLDEGRVNGVIVAKAEDLKKPFAVSKESLSQFVAGTTINQTFDVEFYADCCGEIEIYFSDKLPLRKETSGHTVF